MIEAKSLRSRGSSTPGHRATPAATAARLPVYLRALSDSLDQGTATVSSEQIAAVAGVGSAVVRKDLSALSVNGTPGVGYSVAVLVDIITTELGLHKNWSVVIAGAGQLGQALANYPGFSAGDFQISAIFDVASSVGKVVGDVEVADISGLEKHLETAETVIAVIAVPGTVAQQICDRFVAAGVHSILNFAPVVLDTPDDVEVRQVDLSTELQILAWHAQVREATVSESGMSSSADHVDRLVVQSPVAPRERS